MSKIGSKLMPSGVTTRTQSQPLGPGVVLYNVVSFNPTDILSILAGDTSMGRYLGLLTASPTFSVSQETVNALENIEGLNAKILGSEQLVSQEVSIECEFAEMSRDNMKLALPGLTEAIWLGSTNASATSGTGNAAIKVTALTEGTGANTNYSLVIGTPAGATTTVAVTGTLPSRVITITPSATGTVNEAVAAVNANTTANKIVQAGRPSTSDGTGALLAQISQAFAGGTAGSRIGERLTHKGYWTTADRLRNVAIVLESTNTKVAHIFRVKNAISMDDFSGSFDTNQVTGVGMTFSAEVDENDYDSGVGNYRAPFEHYLLDPVLV